MIIDIIVILVVALGFYSGYTRGIIKTVFDTASLLIAVLFVLKFSPGVMDFIESSTGLNRFISFALGLILTFLGVLFLVRLIGKQLEKLLNAIKLGILNKLAGGVLLAIVYAVFLSFIAWFLTEARLIPEQQKEKSVTLPMLTPLKGQSASVFTKIKPIFTEFWGKIVDMADDLKEETEKLNEPDNSIENQELNE